MLQFVVLPYRIASGREVARTVGLRSVLRALNDVDKRGMAHMSIYDAASGAVVFAVGSIQWAWGLDDYNVPTLRQSRLSLAAQHITRNVLQRFLSAANNNNLPRLDAATPS